MRGAPIGLSIEYPGDLDFSGLDPRHLLPQAFKSGFEPPGLGPECPDIDLREIRRGELLPKGNEGRPAGGWADKPTGASRFQFVRFEESGLIGGRVGGRASVLG